MLGEHMCKRVLTCSCVR